MSYTLRFAAVVAVIASAVVATVAIALESRQDSNRLLDRRLQILEAVGLRAPGERLSREEVMRRFDENVRGLVVDRETGAVVPDAEPTTFDQRRASQDPTTSRRATENRAGVVRVPDRVLVYHLVRRTDGGDAEEVEAIVLPFEGVGLWSTMYGYLALSADLARVVGVTFYEHGETAGLGALITDADWRALWVDRRVFDDDWVPALRVVKGPAGPPAESPFEVDGLAGATLTGNGVTEALRFWLGEDGLGPYLRRYRAERGIP